MLIPPRFLLDAFVVLVMVSIGSAGAAGRTIHSSAKSRPAGTVSDRQLRGSADYRISSHTDHSDGYKRPHRISAAGRIAGTPAALQFTRTARDRLAFVATLAFILSMAAVVIAPVAVQVVPHAQSQYRPGAALLLGLLLQLVAPLAVGAVIARIWPPVVAPLSRWLDIVATLTFLLLMWETRAIRREAFRTLGSGLVVALFALLFASMAVGWFLGGPDRETRRVMATSTSMRNIVVTFFIARYWFPGTPVYLVPIAYLGIMVPANMLFTLYRKIRHKREVTISAVSP